MKLLPLYTNCLLKSDAISGGTDLGCDDRAFAMSAVSSMDVASSVVYFYPRCSTLCLLLLQVRYTLFALTPGAVHFVYFYPRCGTFCLLLPHVQYTLFTLTQVEYTLLKFTKVRYTLFTYTTGGVHFVNFNARCSTLRLLIPPVNVKTLSLYI